MAINHLGCRARELKWREVCQLIAICLLAHVFANIEQSLIFQDIGPFPTLTF
jgi:hypothetical protein